MAVDTDEIIEWLLDNRFLLSLDLSTHYDTHPAAHTLVFNPDRPCGAGCDQLIVASYNPMLYRAGDPSTPPLSDATIDYLHPRIRSHDDELADEYHAFILEGYGAEIKNHPSFGTVEKSWTNKVISETAFEEQVLLLSVSGFARYVERPDVFLGGLPRAYDMWINEGVWAETARDRATLRRHD